MHFGTYLRSKSPPIKYTQYGVLAYRKRVKKR